MKKELDKIRIKEQWVKIPDKTLFSWRSKLTTGVKSELARIQLSGQVIGSFRIAKAFNEGIAMPSVIKAISEYLK